MDFRQLARYYDRQQFENLNLATGVWYGTSLCQLKVSDKFQTIFHRPTRKRMLYCAPDQAPQSTVIRLVGTTQVYFVGPRQDDHHQNTEYRHVYGVHQALGTATITRAEPAGPSNDPGWLVPAVLSPTTYADVELRSLNENEESQEVHRGHFFLTLPAATDVQRSDVVTLLGRQYYVLEPYIDSSMVICRVAEHGDPRKNLVYRDYTGDTYVNAVATRAYINYNVTGRIVNTRAGEVPSDIALITRKIYIRTDHIGVVPVVGDRVQEDGVDYEVISVYNDFLEDHWELTVRY